VNGSEVCNFCNKNLNASTEPQLSIHESPAPNPVGALKEAFSKPAESDGPEGVINMLIRRMWWWVSAQAVVLGFWAGSAFPTNSCHYDAYWGQTVCSSDEFNFAGFLIGVLVGLGFFAPAVYLFQAFREVIRSVNNNK
jgi:hypothetical protein